MCRLLAKVSATPESSSYELLKAPHSFMRQSEHARTTRGFGGHSDGCGIAWLDSDGIRLEKRGHEDRWDGSFRGLAEEIKISAYIAHNRASSEGLLRTARQSHPYLARHHGEDVSFCHNGEVGALMPEAVKRGITDSELFMEHLLAQIDQLSAPRIAHYLSRATRAWPDASMNAMVLTKDGVIAWRCYTPSPEVTFDQDRYFSLYVSEGRERTVVASEPLDESPLWQPVSNRTVLALKRVDGSVTIERVRF